MKNLYQSFPMRLIEVFHVNMEVKPRNLYLTYTVKKSNTGTGSTAIGVISTPLLRINV